MPETSKVENTEIPKELKEAVETFKAATQKAVQKENKIKLGVKPAIISNQEISVTSGNGNGVETILFGLEKEKPEEDMAKLENALKEIFKAEK